MASEPVHIAKHEPERRRRPAVTMYVGCCCCLHTVGSIIGAAITTHLRRDRSEPDPRAIGVSAATVFWSLSFVLVLLAFLCGILADPSNESMIRNVALGIAIGFPAIQIISLFLTLILFSIWRTDQSYQMDYLGNIVVGIIFGSMIGGGLMLIAGMVFDVIRP